MRFLWKKISCKNTLLQGKKENIFLFASLPSASERRNLDYQLLLGISFLYILKDVISQVRFVFQDTGYQNIPLTREVDEYRIKYVVAPQSIPLNALMPEESPWPPVERLAIPVWSSEQQQLKRKEKKVKEKISKLWRWLGPRSEKLHLWNLTWRIWLVPCFMEWFPWTVIAVCIYFLQQQMVMFWIPSYTNIFWSRLEQETTLGWM